MKPILFALSLLVAMGAALAEQLPATLQWAEYSNLSTPVSGRVTTVRADVGDRVEKNDLLATLDPRPFRAEVRRAEADLKRQEGALRIAERELRHAEELFDRTVLSTTALEDAKIRVETARAAVERARAELTLARLNLEYSRLHAPFGGVVVERRISQGVVVSNRCDITPMFRIARGDSLRAIARITPEQATGLARGDTLRVRIGDKTYDGRIQQILPTDGNPSLLELGVLFQANGVQPGDKAAIELAR